LIAAAISALIYDAAVEAVAAVPNVVAATFDAAAGAAVCVMGVMVVTVSSSLTVSSMSSKTLYMLFVA